MDRPRRDEEIVSRYITFVNAEGEVQRRVPVKRVLDSIDRNQYFLIEVDPNANPPVCRLFDKKLMFAKQKQQKKNKTAKPGGTEKEIQFAWNVSDHDMQHKLGKARQLLEKGNKVKIEIVTKKGQIRPSQPDQQEVIQRVANHLDGFKAKKPAFSGGMCAILYSQS